MMNSKKSPESVKWKYLFFIVLAFTLCMVKNEVQAQEETAPKVAAQAIGKAKALSETKPGKAAVQSQVAVGTTTSQTATVASGRSSEAEGAVGIASSPEAAGIGNNSEKKNIFVVIRSNMSKTMLEQIQSELQEHGIKLTYPELEYDSEGRITNIQIRVKEGNQFNGSAFSYNDGKPIVDPIAFYRSYSPKEGFGVYQGIPDDLPDNVRSFLQNLSGITVGDWSFD